MNKNCIKSLSFLSLDELSMNRGLVNAQGTIAHFGDGGKLKNL